MAGSLNKVMLIGHLGADPEVRSLNNGGRVCNLRLATSESWKDKQTNERKERTEWHRVVVFNDQLVKVCEDYLRKGSMIYLEGQIQTRKWQDQGGEDKYSTEIVLQNFNGVIRMLDKRQDGDQAGGGYQRDGGGGSNQSRHQRDDSGGGYSGGREDFSADLDDEIPF